MNQVILIGRLIDDPKIEKEGAKKVCKITLAVTRNFKNSEGTYDIDFIDCILWNIIAEKICEYCKKNYLVSVKGNIQKLKDDDTMKIVAENISFLQSSSDKKGK